MGSAKADAARKGRRESAREDFMGGDVFWQSGGSVAKVFGGRSNNHLSPQTGGNICRNLDSRGRLRTPSENKSFYFRASGVTVNSSRLPSRSTITLTATPIFTASRL